MFITTLFTVVKLCNQPRHPTVDEWIKKLWYIYTVGFYSAIKKNEIMLFVGKWMELEFIMLSEINQSHKLITCFVSCGIWGEGRT
jgi:hypothetical protein